MTKNSLTKDQYLIRNFSKINHKGWELYVVTRVLHLLADDDIEYVCQQYINPPNNSKYYLADLCFPSLKLYLEINEIQHDSKKHKEDDKIRQREILDATEWEQWTIDVYTKDSSGIKDKPLKDVDNEIDDFLNYVKTKKLEIETKSGEKLTWNYEDKFEPYVHIKKGYIDATDNVVFRYHKQALELFGYKGSHYQRSYWRIRNHNQAVWFPKLYDRKPWKNSLSRDNKEIIQQKIVNGILEDVPLPNKENRIVFAHYKNILGQTVYKFYGEYEVDWEKTKPNTHVFRRLEPPRLYLKKYQQ